MDTSIFHQGIIIPFAIRRSMKAKRVSIRIASDRTVTLVAPPGVPEDILITFARKNSAWIYSHTLGSVKPLPPVRTYTSGERYSWFGSEVTLRIIPGKKGAVLLDGSELCVPVSDDFPSNYQPARVKEQLEHFFSLSLYEYIDPLVRTYASLFEVPVPVIKIRHQKTKWGSCTPRCVTFNLRLCMADPEIIEYVAAHELCHKVHPNHSMIFWRTLEDVMPDYVVRKDRLRRNGYLWIL